LVLASSGRNDEAIVEYEQAIALRPDYAEIHFNLGIAQRISGNTQEAMAAYRRAIAINPRFAEAFNNYGHVLRKAGQLEEALDAYSEALAIRFDYIEARNNLGVTLKDLRRLDEAIGCFRDALEIQPDCAAVHSNLVFALHYHPDYDAETLFREHVKWNDQHAKPQAAVAHENDPSPGRRLKIGYVSPDFREHCQALFTTPLLSHHDHGAFEIFCYALSPTCDAVTRELEGYADHWRNVSRMSDEQIAQQIREDEIDVLVDLTLHMSNNRLGVFALKPAPVQVSWLGYPSTTGLSAMDYRLSDPHLDPPGERDEWYVEKSLRLPHTFWCYDPRSEIAANDLPALRNGRITFGCLNNFCKINERVLKTWREILLAVPNASLRLLAPRGDCRKSLLSMIGVDSSRIEFMDFQPREEYLRLYHDIDLCIDTFPYNGHTTSLDSLWMGVPVVSLCGETAVSRAGFSQASNLGLTELIAHAPEEFVKIAVQLANDLPRLAEMRKMLRGRMNASPLMDAARFARDVEQAFGKMWLSWCNEKTRAKRSEDATMNVGR
jgi:predicted O-linked N-acetylglucosamine transferase (SPINDLY family)